MKKEFSAKEAFIALLLAVVLAFSAPVNLVYNKAEDNASYSVGSNKSQLQMHCPDSDSKTDSAAQNSAETAGLSYMPEIAEAEDIQHLNTTEYQQAASAPVSDTSVTADDILPDDNSTVTEIPSDNEVVQEGVTVVPAMLNNTMRDSLANIVSKKVYTFTADKRGAVVYAFNHIGNTDQSCTWYITLYEEYSPDGTGENTDYRVLNRLTYSKIGKGVRSSTIGILPGNYRVEVQCVSGFTEEKYDIIIGYLVSDSYETEYNDSETRYTELPLNKTLNGGASAYPDDVADVDYYLFRVTDSGYTVLYFNHENDTEGTNGAIAWRIKIVDMQGNEYYQVTSDMNKSMINSGVMGLPVGYYFVVVNSHIYSGVSYSLSVSFIRDSAVETELNDTIETADEIAVNTEKIGALTNRNDKSDRDWFVFNMEKDGFIVIDFIHEALNEEKDGWNISVIAEDGRIAYSTVSDWNQPVLQSPSIGLTAGRYYILIDSDNLYHSSIVYRLILLTIESEGWETEPNNTVDSADIINIGGTVNGTMIEMGTDFDKDYFAIDIPTAGVLSVAFAHIVIDEPGKEGWIVSVVDAEGNVISSMTSDWDSTAEMLTAEVEAGRYYILVETGLYFNTSRYVFATTLE